MRKRLLSTLLVLCMVLALMPGTAHAATTSGTCGANLQWNLNTSTMVLTITGSGAMSDYYGGPPWQEYVSEIKEIVLSQNITYIGACAFIGCTALENVTFPSSVTSIGYAAFSNCYGLVTVNIPDTVTSVGDMAFINCTGLISARAPARVISNGKDIFSGCTSLSNITIPNGTTAIGSGMFNSCYSLTSVSIPNGVTRIGAYAFTNCSGLTSVSIPESVEIINDQAFAGCTSLSHVDLPEGLKSLGLAAFMNCTGLNRVTIPDTVTDMGKPVSIYGSYGSVFLGCTGLTSAGPLGGEYSIQYGWTDKIPAYAFSECTGLTSVEFPDGMSEIGDYAFYRCASLTNIEFPDGMFKIGDWAFYYCTGLTSIDLPDSMLEIGDCAFYDCFSLAKATLLRNISAIGENTFSYCYPLTIYCYQYSYAHQYAIAHNIPFVLLDGEPDQSGTAQILSLSPQSGAKDVSYDSENLPVFQITFDRPIASIEATAGVFSIYRASDDELLYSSRAADDFQYSGAMLTVTPDIQLKPATEYYITLEGEAIRFEDDATNPGIVKGQWNFTTEYFSTVENVVMATNYGSQKTANIPTVWDDAWFAQSTTTYNHELATTSAILSGAVYVDNARGDKGSGSIESALEKLGFDKILPYDFNYAYTDLPVFCDDGAVSFCLAVKEIENKLESGPIYLLAIIVQGTTGSFIDGEWLNNLYMGLGTEHRGFLAANDRLKEVLADYSDRLRDQGFLLNADNMKFFLTGHSRGAAVANLFAAQLSERMGSDNVYAYTFATPTVSKAAQENGYENIFNIVNADDLVPKMPPTGLGYSRYGIDLLLPSRSYYGKGFDTIYQRMNRQFNTLTGEDYLDEGSMIHSDQLVGFTKDIIGIVASKNPKDKVETVVSSVIDAMGLIAQYIVDLTQAHSMALYYSWMDTCTPDELFTKATSFKRVNIACPVDVYVYDESNNIVASIIDEQVDVNILAVSVENGEKTIDLPSDQGYSIKIIAREDGLVNYTVSELSTEPTGDPILRTVEFYDIDIVANDTLTGKVNSSLYTDAKNYALTKNGEEVIDADSDSLNPSPSTPPTPDHTHVWSMAWSSNVTSHWHECTAQGCDVTADSGKDGYDTHISGEWIIDQEATSTAAGQRHKECTVCGYIMETETIPAIGGGSSTQRFTVIVNANPVEGGSVSGGSTYNEGESVTVRATPVNGYQFVRWTENGSAVSTSTAYTFTATADRILTAIFEKVSNSGGSSTPDYSSSSDSDSTYSITVPSRVTGGTIKVTPTSASERQRVTIMVKPNTGYELDILTATDSKGNALTLTDQSDGKYTFTMPSSKVSINVSFTATAPTTPVESINFTDVQPSAYYYDAVLWAVENNITYGITDTTFSPDVACSRAQIVSFLWRTVGSPKMSVANPFTDVSATDYYYDAVLWAVENSITAGSTDTTFSPNATCTRAQAVTFLYRTKNSPAVSGTNGFTDLVSGAYYTDAVQWVVNTKVTAGTSATTFSPDQTCTRAQIVSFLYRDREE